MRVSVVGTEDQLEDGSSGLSPGVQMSQQEIDVAGMFFSRGGAQSRTSGLDKVRSFQAEGLLQQQMLQGESFTTSPQSAHSLPRNVRVSMSETTEVVLESATKKGGVTKKVISGALKDSPDGVIHEDETDTTTVKSDGKLSPQSATPSGKSRKSMAATQDEPRTGQPLRFSGKKSLIMKSRMRRLLERRREEFSAYPPLEQARLRQAFNAGDPSGLAMLDAKGLRRAFSELGLEGRMRKETEAIGSISREAAVRGNINFFDFVFQLVPEVEHKLEELRSPKLYAEFQKIDTNGIGRLKEQQCLAGLERHARSMQGDEESAQAFWKAFVKDFPDMYRAKSTGTEGTVDFKGFQLLATQLDTRRADYFQRLEKRIACVENIPPQMEVAHSGELSCLKRMFDQSDLNSTGSIAGIAVTHALLQTGVAAPVGVMWDRLQQVMDECEGFHFAFKDFLHMVDGIRDDSKGILKVSVQALFKSYNLSWTSTPSIVSSEVPALMMELSCCKDCCTNEEALAGFVESYDKDSCGGDLDMDTLIALIFKVSEASRAHQREFEAAVARQLSFSMKQVIQMRVSFAGLTTTGSIGVPEVRQWFKEINPDVKPVTRDIVALMLEVSPTVHRRHERDNNLDVDDDDGFDRDSRQSSRDSRVVRKAPRDPNLDSDDEFGQPDGGVEDGGSHRSSFDSADSATMAKVRSVPIPKFDNEISAIPAPGVAAMADKPQVEILGLEDSDEDIPMGRTSTLGQLQAAFAEKKPQPNPQVQLQAEDQKLGEEQTQEDDPASDPESWKDDRQDDPELYFDGYMRLMSMIMKA